MNQMEIMLKTQELLDLIESSDDIKRYKELEKQVLNDQELVKKINHFKKVNDAFLEFSKYGEYHPNFKEKKNEIIALKNELFRDELFKAYKDCEMTLDFLMTDLAHLFQDIIRTDETVCHPGAKS